MRDEVVRDSEGDEMPPDFTEFKQVVLGEKDAKRVHLIELILSQALARTVVERDLGGKWIPPGEATVEQQWDQNLAVWQRLGYDYIRVAGGLNYPMKRREVAEPAFGANRQWVEEGRGMVSTWEEFEQYPWPRIVPEAFRPYEYVSKRLPEGMKMLVCPSSGVFEVASEHVLGFDGMSYLLADKPDLVEAVFDKVGAAILAFYGQVVDIDGVEGFFQGDDLGFKTGTFLSPAHLRKLVIPWHRKFAKLARDRGKLYLLHCCGDISRVMDDFIDDVKMDGLHSFQDEIFSVAEFRRRWGLRTAALGGVDVDKLCQLPEEDLRAYVRSVLDAGMPKRYALGSGNSITEYMPVESYCIMLEEGRRWKG